MTPAALIRQSSDDGLDLTFADRLDRADREAQKIILRGAGLLDEDETDPAWLVAVNNLIEAEYHGYPRDSARLSELSTKLEADGTATEETLQDIVGNMLKARMATALALGIAMGRRLGA